MQLLYCHCVSASLIRVLPSGNKSCALKAQIAVAGFTSNLVKSCQHLHSCTSPHSGLKSEMFSFCDNPGVCLIRSPEVLCSHTWYPTYTVPHTHGTLYTWHPTCMAPHMHGIPYAWHPTHLVPHIHGTPHMTPHIHGTLHTWHPTHMASHTPGTPYT